MLKTIDTERKATLAAHFTPYTLRFKKPAGTARGILRERKIWLLILHQRDKPGVRGIGECAPLKGLSADDRADFGQMLRKVCSSINDINFWLREGLRDFPAIRFGLETALLDFCNAGKKILYPSAFTEGKDSIRINGLIWMGDFDSMKRQAKEKIAAGFHCIKMKIGAMDFEKELALLKFIGDMGAENQVELRVDANGAFTPREAMRKLERLAALNIHSIEQPVKQGQWKVMAELCAQTPVPIALDEELIGIKTTEEKRKLLSVIRPHYIILKPTLVGGFSGAMEWIKAAKENNTGWWITSALESNIGLNAIAQWTYTLGTTMPQGLGTGQLFANNFSCPLHLSGENLFFDPKARWKLPEAFA